MPNHQEAALKLAARTGIIRTRDATTAGIPRMALTRLCRSGRLKRLARGLYVRPGQDVSEHHALALAATLVPRGIVCLLSALRFHGLTTQSPFEVWLAIDRKARKPQPAYPPLRIVRFSGEALRAGVDAVIIENVPVQITCAARTVSDCFRYRNKIGLDIAIEALRGFLELPSRSIDDLWNAAAIGRVQTVMRPYLEALT